MSPDSEFLFEATWEGTPLPGRFGSFDVVLFSQSADSIAGSTLTVSVQLAAADMDDPDINEAIAGPEWFSVEEHPAAIYESEEVVSTGPGTYLAKGALKLKGVDARVDVPFTWSQSDGQAQMKGEFVIDRTTFDVGSGEWADDTAIGIDVRLSFDLVLEKQ